MAFEEVEGRGDFPPSLTLEEGDSLTGILVAANKVTVDGKYGKRETFVYYVRVEGGVEVEGENGKERVETCALWGSVDLDSKLSTLPVPSRIQVTYTGKTELDGGKSMKVYAVMRDKDWTAGEGDDIPF